LSVTIGCLAAAGGAASTAMALAAHSGARSRPAPPQALDALPFPGTPDAAPGTNIDLPAVSPAQVASVTAVGSRSGLHTGRLGAQPAGHGSAFTPDRPFSPGERVSVTATFRSAAAGTASGAPGATQISFSFSVAQPGSTAGSRAPRARASRLPATSTSHSLTHSFVTHPGFKVPVVAMSGRDADAAAGDIFLDAHNSGQNAAYILNPRGALLWYRPIPSQEGAVSVQNVRMQSYHGTPVITYWQGKFVNPPGAGRGEDLILNHHYQTIHTVKAGNGYRSQGADEHEFVLGHQGSEPTAFISIFAPAQANLTSIGGPANGPVYDWIIQEIDIPTGKVIWEWHALGHVPVRYSHLPFVFGQRYDFFHLDSIQQLKDGNILVSSRNTWAVYLIDKKSGKVVWRVGGKHPSFKMGRHTNFEWQHDATLHPRGVLTVFDDADSPREERQSRALTLHVSTTAHRVTLVHQYRHSPATLASSQGSDQILPNGNVFVGWGSKPYFSEYSPRGAQIFGGSFRSPVDSYRAFRFGWVGSPVQPPTIAVRPATTAGEDALYVSWNGSTQVRKWQVLASSSAAGPFAKVGSPTPWSGFETKLHAPKANYFKVQALNSRGHVLGVSAAAAGH
jgi:hypothetical protein